MEVESGAGYLSSLLNNGPSIGVAANLRAIDYGMNSRNQNGVNDDVVSAIDKLRKDMSNNGDTYNINGITYDDGTNVSEAVKWRVVRGDCLWNIAKSVYKNPYRWTDIASANGVSQRTALIYPGQILTLPGISGGGSSPVPNPVAKAIT